MFSGITFDTDQVMDIAMSLIVPFMPLVYIIGGVTVFGLVLLVIIAVVKKAAG